jgi:predicted NAD/FAD-binding protein
MRVAIVGGGVAGLTTAWLPQDSHEVMLFERQPRLGGHAQTIDVVHGGQAVAIDVGAEFFGNAKTYPLFRRLLNLLSVPTRSFSATATVYGAQSRRKLVLPPWRQGAIDWSALTPAGVADLSRFGAFSMAVARSKESELRQETIGQFLERSSSREFERELLIPFLLGQFGMPRAFFDDCLAYDILKYCALAGPMGLSAPVMIEVVGGTRAYIDKLDKALGQNCVSTGVAVVRIEFDGPGSVLALADGQRYSADHVIIATGVADVGRLYPANQTCATVQSAVATVDTFEAELVIHGDESIMPRDRKSWSVANLRRTAEGAAFTVWKPWLSPTPLFRSWVTGENRVLRNEHGRFRFRHPIGNGKYYAAQTVSRALQGQDNIWFAGSYVHDNDCHESAIASAVTVARALAPRTDRLKLLCA